jgi:hypothetical protein
MADVNYQVGANADDGHWIEGSSFDATSNGPFVGNISGVRHSFARWTGVLVPQGAIINSAKLVVMGRAISGTGKTNIYFNDENTAVAPTTYGEADGKALTSAVVGWNISAFVNGTWYDSPDISTVIKEIVDRPGWSSGNDMMLIWKENGSTSGSYISWTAREVNTASAIYLYITYTAGGTGGVLTVNYEGGVASGLQVTQI